jgi:hypothetical protein
LSRRRRGGAESCGFDANFAKILRCLPDSDGATYGKAPKFELWVRAILVRALFAGDAQAAQIAAGGFHDQLVVKSIQISGVTDGCHSICVK